MAPTENHLSVFLNYLANIQAESDSRVPALSELSKEIGLSVATLREQLESAKVLGVVEVKPKVGIRKTPFEFKKAIKPGLDYAIASGSISFHHFADLRKHLESAYFIEAVQQLSAEDILKLEELINSAQLKINSYPSQVPADEHREFHTFIYRKLENPYLDGMLDAFWDVYQKTGYDVNTDLSHIERVWRYHARIVEMIKTRQYSQGLSLLMEHMELVPQREKVIPRLSFE